MSGDEQTEVDRGFLAQTSIFGGLPERVLARLLSVATVVHVPGGTNVFEEGEPARSMFIVRDGELEICKRRRNGTDQCVAMLHRGDCVGEMSLIDIQPRSATVRAHGEAALYVLDHLEIARLYQTDLEVYTLLMLNIAREISRRLRLADQRLLEMGLAVPGMP